MGQCRNTESEIPVTHTIEAPVSITVELIVKNATIVIYPHSVAGSADDELYALEPRHCWPWDWLRSAKLWGSPRCGIRDELFGRFNSSRQRAVFMLEADSDG